MGSHTENGVSTGLKDYISRMQEGQRHIYYLCAPNRELAESSPYFEALKAKNVEILFCFDAYDEVLMMQLQKFDDKQLFSGKTKLLLTCSSQLTAAVKLLKKKVKL